MFIFLMLATAVHSQVSVKTQPLIFPTNRTSFRHGDTLTCVADNSPQLEYHWVINAATKSGRVLTVDICDITSDKLVQQQLAKDASGDQFISVSVICVARGGGQNSAPANRDITVMFTDEEIKKNCAGSRVLFLAVGLVVSSAVAMITIAVAVIYARRRLECKCVKNGKSAAEENSLSNEVAHYAEIREPEIETASVHSVPPLPVAAAVVGNIDVHYENVPSRHRMNETIIEDIVMSKPYDMLNPETREAPRPPTVYSRLSRTRP